MLYRREIASFLGTLCILGLQACDNDEKEVDSASTDDSSGETCCGETETQAPPASENDSPSDTSPSWQDISIASVTAPTRDTVRIVLSRDPGAELAGAVNAYSLTRSGESLDVLSVSYDPQSRTASLTTSRQKLGVMYMLEILDQGEPISGLVALFPSADTATFWVADWTNPGYAQIELTAQRKALGETCVIYVEEGHPSDNAEAAAQAFDSQIFDIETQTFTDAPDQDGNSKIAILWLDGQGYFGGYFDPLNTYSNTLTEAWWGLHSNEMELLHLDVGTMSYGTDYFIQIAAHEFQHLLYNKRHGNQAQYFAYHDEGLAEMAVHLVTGNNDYAVDFFFADEQGLIGAGLSLVNWTYALYENYVLAYLFWTYTAGQLGGIDSIGEVFDLDSGNPNSVSEFLESRLGVALPEAHRRSLISAWAQQTSGEFGFGGLLDLNGRVPPSVPAGTSSTDLQPFAGAFFPLASSEVDYPGTQGEHIVYAGIDAAGNVDLEAPFVVEGGALLVYNANFEYEDFTAEASGPDQAAVIPAAPRAHFLDARVSPAWNDPPPVSPDHVQLLDSWKRHFVFGRQAPARSLVSR